MHGRIIEQWCMLPHFDDTPQMLMFHGVIWLLKGAFHNITSNKCVLDLKQFATILIFL